MDGVIFESGKNKLRIQNSDPDTCGQDLKEKDKTLSFNREEVFLSQNAKRLRKSSVIFSIKAFKSYSGTSIQRRAKPGTSDLFF